jgi:hypothetical protein
MFVLCLIGLLTQHVDYVPTDEIIDALALQIGKIALNLGIELGLDAYDLEIIQNDYQRDLVKQTRRVLYDWRNDKTVKATLGVLAQALINVGRGATCLEKVVEEKGVSRKHNAEGALSKTRDRDLQAKDSKSNVQTVIYNRQWPSEQKTVKISSQRPFEEKTVTYSSQQPSEEKTVTDSSQRPSEEKGRKTVSDLIKKFESPKN